MGRIWGKLALTLSLAGALTLALGAAQAFAQTVVDYFPDPNSTFLSITDFTGNDDVVNVSVADNTITITDTAPDGITTTDPDCTQVNANTVTCPLDPPDPPPPDPPNGPVRFVGLFLNDGTDSFTNQNVMANVFESDSGTIGNKTISSGPGDDGINTGTGNDSIDTGTGQDSASGGSGDDTIVTGPEGDFGQGDAGNDTLDMGEGQDFISEDAFTNGADTLNGGPGASDGVGYGGENPVTMTLNGQADDGHAGEGDNIVPGGTEDLFGGGGNDVIAGDDVSNDLDGNDGDDQISGAGAADRITPGDGNDTADGGEGNDNVDGGFEPDGADLLAGGGGSGDLVDYCCGREPVSINQNGQADDGRAGEGDNLSGFEGFEGSAAADAITADGSPNLISGNAGADLLVGNGGGDRFLAGQGDDTVVSSGGSSIARGTALARALAPRDELQCDLSTGFAGSDGPGFDTVSADARDRVGADCERRGAEVDSESARVNKKGKAKVRVACPQEEGAPCTGKLALLSNGKQVGKGKYKNIANGKKKNTTAKLSKKGRKALARSNGSLLVSAEARTREPPGITANAEDLLLTRAKKGGGGGGKR